MMAFMRLYTFAALIAVSSVGSSCVGDAAGGGDGASNSETLGPSEAALQAADSLVAEWVAAETVAGAVLMVSHGGQVVLNEAHGWSRLHDYDGGQYRGWEGAPPGPERQIGAGLQRLDSPVTMTPGTAFDLASVTKVMATTFAVMLLVDSGELDLDAPLFTYLLDFRGGPREKITVRHLLTHRAGLRQWQPIYYSALGPDAAYKAILGLPLEWPVGEGRHYSDLGFMLLGRMVETVSGAPLGDFLSERLYSPLGLSSTGFRGANSSESSPMGPFAATSHGNPFEFRMVHDSTFGYRYPR